jgi:hypothetical protein
MPHGAHPAAVVDPLSRGHHPRRPASASPGFSVARQPSAATLLDPVAPASREWHGRRVADPSFPVTVLVQRPNGASEHVRVGTAVREGDSFRLTLGELAIGTTPDAASARRPAASASSGGEGMTFPPYGRSRGAPIAGASTQDLEFYISGSRRSLDDPSKSRWHEKERVLLAAMEAELARQKGGGGGASASDDDFYDNAAPQDDDLPF